MKKFNTLAVCGALSVSMAASVLAGCGEKAVDGTQTAMVIDGDEISLGTANYILRTEQANTYAQMQGMMAYLGGGDGSSFWSLEGEDGVTYGASFKETTVENLTRLVEIRKHAEEQGVSVTDEEMQRIQDAAKAFTEKNAEAVKKLGVSEENVCEALELQTLEIKIKPQIVAAVDKVVSDEEAAQTTVTYIRLKKPDDEAELKTAKEQMEQILAKVKKADAGDDLKELSKAVNEEAYAAQYHYNKGAYDEESNVLETAVKDVLPDLKDGEVYDKVIDGTSYLYIIRLDHVFDKEKTEAQKETIVSQRENTLYEDTVSGWVEGITAETNDCWDKIVVDDEDPYVLPQQ